MTRGLKLITKGLKLITREAETHIQGAETHNQGSETHIQCMVQLVQCMVQVVQFKIVIIALLAAHLQNRIERTRSKVFQNIVDANVKQGIRETAWHLEFRNWHALLELSQTLEHAARVRLAVPHFQGIVHTAWLL